MSAFATEMDRMMQDVTELMGTTIKLFKPSTSPAANATTLTRSPSYDSVTVSGNEHPVEKETIFQDGKNAVLKTYVYDVRAADVTLGIPDESWLLGIGADATSADALKIISVDQDANMKGLVIRARKGA